MNMKILCIYTGRDGSAYRGLGSCQVSCIYDQQGEKEECHSSYDHYDLRRDPYYGITIGGNTKKDDRPLIPENGWDYKLERSNPTGTDDSVFQPAEIQCYHSGHAIIAEKDIFRFGGNVPKIEKDIMKSPLRVKLPLRRFQS